MAIYGEALEKSKMLVSIKPAKEKLDEMRKQIENAEAETDSTVPRTEQGIVARHIENMRRKMDFECLPGGDSYAYKEVKQGDIFECAFDYQTQDSEVREAHPTVVLSRHNANSPIVVVATISHRTKPLADHWRDEKKQHFPPLYVPIFDWGGEYIEGIVDVGQIHTVSKKRLFESLGPSNNSEATKNGGTGKSRSHLRAANMKAVFDAIAYQMGLPESKKPQYPKHMREVYQKILHAEVVRQGKPLSEVTLDLDKFLAGYDTYKRQTEQLQEDETERLAASVGSAGENAFSLALKNPQKQERRAKKKNQQQAGLLIAAAAPAPKKRKEKPLEEQIAIQTARAERKDNKLRKMRAMISEADNLLAGAVGCDEAELEALEQVRGLMKALLELKEEDC